MASAINIARNDLSRAFLFLNGINRCGDTPTYMPCLISDGLSQDFGDRTKVECPDPNRFGEFVEQDTIPGEISRVTTTLTAKFDRKARSTLLNLSKGGCGFDLQLHFGLCTNPNDFNAYDKVLVYDDVNITSYGTDSLGALGSADRAEITETVDISFREVFEVVSLSYIERGATVTAAVSSIIDGVFVDSRACGGACGVASTGCEKAFVIDGDGLTISTVDGGVTWVAGPAMDGAGTGTIAGLDVLAGFLWAYNTAGEISYISRESFLAGGTEQIVTGLSLTGVAQDAGQSYGLVVGPAGEVLYITNPSAGVNTTVTPITAENLSVVKFNPLTDSALIGGANGTIIYTEDGVTLEAITAPSAEAANTVTAVLPVTEDKWLVAFGSTLYCTDDQGVNWSSVSLPQALTAINDLSYSNNHVLYMAADLLLFKSIDGGRTWAVAPENSSKSFPTNLGMNRALTCVDEINVVYGLGQDTGGAGMVIQGQE